MGAPARCELMLKRQPQSFGRIFEPFFKRHHDGRGAGLGPNLVRDILRMHRRRGDDRQPQSRRGLPAELPAGQNGRRSYAAAPGDCIILRATASFVAREKTRGAVVRWIKSRLRDI